MGGYEFIWLNEHEPNWSIFENIFCNKLVLFYDKFIRNTYEIPFQYPERSFVGHVAIASNGCGLYTIQDFESVGYEKNRRPDLWLAQTKNNKFTSYLIEFKKDINVYLDVKTRIEMKEKYENRFHNYEIDEYGEVLGLQHVDYQGVFIAITIFCNGQKWKKLKNNQNIYDQKLNDLKELWITRKYWLGSAHFPNFGFCYSISHNTLAGIELQDSWEIYEKLPVALFLFGWLRAVPITL
jgi:hypothetical protein